MTCTMSDIGLFDFKLNDYVLLVGEGNFSFSCCLLKVMQEKYGAVKFCNFYASCFQTELSSNASENVDYLKTRGAVVLLGVDATKLEDVQQISSLKFNKIIFNFPHVGGKMKIHLNRKLLCQFFISTSKFLKPGAQVIVALCSGQGGTGFDITSRRWDDTWQIVEQAAHGSFVLVDTHFFPNELFLQYHPVGYRGREQMFSTKSAVVHGFCLEMFPLTHFNDSFLQEILSFYPIDETGELLVSYAHKLALNENPLLNDNSSYSYILNIIKDSFKKLTTNYVDISCKMPYNTKFNVLQAPCLYKKQQASLRKSLFQVMPQGIEEDFIASGIVFEKSSSDFSRKTTHIHCIIKSPLFRLIVHDMMSSLALIFDFSGIHCEETTENSWILSLESSSCPKSSACWADIVSGNVTIDLDILCAHLFQVSVREIQSRKLKFDSFKKSLILPSLYPPHFTFDISFSSKKNLNFDQFYNVLHQMPDNLIDSVSLLSTFEHKDKDEISYCFRLTYMSYEKPLFRKLVIDIHQNVIGKTLENTLEVYVH